MKWLGSSGFFRICVYNVRCFSSTELSGCTGEPSVKTPKTTSAVSVFKKSAPTKTPLKSSTPTHKSAQSQKSADGEASNIEYCRFFVAMLKDI